jgi:hypothetical protein
MSKKIILTKPKITQIGLIPFNNSLLSNDTMKLNMTNIFLKKNKYFFTIDKNKSIDDKIQIINFVDENYNLKINADDIYYIGLRGNVMIYSIMIKNKKDLCDGILYDYTDYDKYSWKTFFDVNFENNSNNYEGILKNKKYNLHMNHCLISENKKQRLTIEELYSCLKNHIKIN